MTDLKNVLFAAWFKVVKAASVVMENLKHFDVPIPTSVEVPLVFAECADYIPEFIAYCLDRNVTLPAMGFRPGSADSHETDETEIEDAAAVRAAFLEAEAAGLARTTQVFVLGTSDEGPFLSGLMFYPKGPGEPWESI